MAGLNSFCCCGRLVGDAVAINSQKGGCRFRIAVDGYRKEETLFMDAVKFGDVGNVLPYLTKGASVAVSGSIRPSEWTDREGRPVRGVQLVAANLQLVGPRRQDEGLAASSHDSYGQAFEGGPETFKDAPFDDTDIPF